MTGELSVDEVTHIARLARLDLDAEEIQHFAEQLSAILEHVDTVRGLDTADVPATSHALDLRNVLRADELRPCLDRAEVLAAAPASEDGRFRVPRILGEAP